ncbi:unnamed protein product [Bursaphelenchus xylophilus]|uniref:(pine wood nematode) hypothetical protein n=1 Tax=Bursaphelenchus xylophilus TaxID=6326 RepID=A0A7I8X0J5_BURXY|nr:unnamed protein product [Bursaphelenchus xylophilus]CAG9129753.1 unnamed protein product [Bursaphelenchus xylophilus]
MCKILLFTFILIHSLATGKECEENQDCQTFWPKAVCSRGRCRCGKDFLRRKSESFGWVCLSLNDAVSGSLGAQQTCPFPAGAGYLVAEKGANGQLIVCDDTDSSGSCGKNFECIGGISAGGGLCCPRKEFTCDPSSVKVDDGGWLDRWYFDGKQCVSYEWNPESTESPNTFTSREQCQSICSK